MKKTTKTGLLACALLVFGFAMISGVKADVNTTTDVTLTVTAGDIVHGITWSNASGLTLPGVMVSNSAQTTSGDFGNDSFFVDDQKWSESGWYTTLSVTPLTGQVNAAHTIPATAVKLQAATENFTQSTNMSNGLKASAVTMGSVQTFIGRAAGAAILGTYKTNMVVTVEVPQNTPADTYKGIITYTLIER